MPYVLTLMLFRKQEGDSQETSRAPTSFLKQSVRFIYRKKATLLIMMSPEGVSLKTVSINTNGMQMTVSLPSRQKLALMVFLQNSKTPTTMQDDVSERPFTREQEEHGQKSNSTTTITIKLCLTEVLLTSVS